MHMVEQEDGTLQALSETGAFHIERLHLNRRATRRLPPGTRASWKPPARLRRACSNTSSNWNNKYRP